MTNFPLYDSLVKDLPKRDLTVKQKEDFLVKVQEINDAGTELLVALIQYHALQSGETTNGTTNGTTVEKVPYKGTCVGTKNAKCAKTVKSNTEDITWDLLSFPIKLRQILYKFVAMHLKSMMEEVSRQERHEIC